MLTSYRITKYNPENRNNDGSYKIFEEWTGIGEIGNNLTEEEYFEIENQYVEVVEAFMEINKIKFLNLINVENKFDYKEINNHLIDEKVYKKIGKNISIVINDVPSVIRALLREYFWCKLKGDRGFFIHTGYDLYMYIGFNKCKKIEKQIELLNIEKMYIENFRSPYLKTYRN